VHRQLSGFCQCGEERTGHVKCSHPPFNCMQKCKRLSNWGAIAPAATTGKGGGKGGGGGGSGGSGGKGGGGGGGGGGRGEYSPRMRHV